MAGDGIVVVSVGVGEGFVEHGAGGLEYVHKLLEGVEADQDLLALTASLLVIGDESLQEALLVAPLLSVEHVPHNTSELLNRNGHRLIPRALLQEGVLELIELQRVNLIDNQVQGEALVPFQRLRIQGVLLLLEIARQSGVQEGGLSLQGYRLALQIPGRHQLLLLLFCLLLLAHSSGYNTAFLVLQRFANIPSRLSELTEGHLGQSLPACYLLTERAWASPCPRTTNGR